MELDEPMSNDLRKKPGEETSMNRKRNCMGRALKITSLLVATMLITCLLPPTAFAWEGEHLHAGMAEITANHMGITDDEYLKVMKNGSCDADKYDTLPTFEPEIWQMAIMFIFWPPSDTSFIDPLRRELGNTIYHSLVHSYLPDVDQIDPSVEDLYSISSLNAPNYLTIKANEAQDSFKNHQYSQGYYQLGYAMHYIQDLAQPMHTTIDGAAPFDNIYEDAPTIPPYENYHDAFEIYVYKNWVDPVDDKRPGQPSLQYKNAEMQNSEKYYMNDPGQSAKNVACLSYIFSQYAVEEMNNEPNDWMTDPGIEEGTNWLLVEQDKFNMGLVDYVMNPPS